MPTQMQYAKLTDPVSLGSPKDVNPTLSIVPLEFGAQPVVHLGDPFRLIDTHSNARYHIASLRLLVPASIADTIREIDSSVAGALGAVYPGVTITSPLLDRFDPSRPRIEIRVDVDRQSGIVRTMLFGKDNKVLNQTDTWMPDRLFDVLREGGFASAAVSVECFVNPETKTARLVMRARSLLFCPTSRESAVSSVEDPSFFVSMGHTYGDGLRDLVTPPLVVDDIQAVADKVQAVVSSIPALSYLTVDTTIDLPPSTILYDGEQQVPGGVAVVIGRNVQLKVYARPLIQGDTLVWRAVCAEALDPVSSIEYPLLADWTGGGALHDGHILDDRGLPLILRTGPVINPEIRTPHPNISLLRVLLPSVEQRTAAAKLDDLVKKGSTASEKYFTSFRDGCLFELRLPKGAAALPSGTNQVDVVFAAEYSANESRSQLVPRVISVQAMEPTTGHTEWSGDASAVSFTPPRPIGDGGCHFGMFLVDGAPITLDLGVVHFDSVRELGPKTRLYRCTLEDGAKGAAVLAAVDAHAREKLDDLADATDAAKLAYYSILRDGVLEVRVDHRTVLSGGDIASSNKGRITATVEYSVMPLKERMQAIVRALNFCVQDRDDSWKAPATALVEGIAVQEAIGDLSEESVTFEVPSEDATARQKFLLFRYRGKPQSFQLDDIVLERSDLQRVGLPSPEYEGSKLTVIVDGSNLSFFRSMDEVLNSKLEEMKDAMSIPQKERTRAVYRPIVSTDNEVPVVKFTLDVPKGTTIFSATTGKPLECNTLDDLRPHIRLGTVFSKPVVNVSKIWYDKKERECSVKLKLKSCILRPPSYFTEEDVPGFRVGLV